MVRCISSFSSFLGLILAQEGFKAKNYLFIKLKLRVSLYLQQSAIGVWTVGAALRCAGSKIAGEGLNSHR